MSVREPWFARYERAVDMSQHDPADDALHELTLALQSRTWFNREVSTSVCEVPS